MLTITEERPALSSITAETAGGLHHIWDVVRRWWVLLVLGTVAAVAVGAGAISASKTHYAADAEVAVDQPAQTLEPGGLPAAQRMAQYINTFSELAVSDKVLDGVRAELGYNLSIEDLRAHVSSAVVLNSVVLKFHTDFPTQGQALAVASAMIREFSKALGRPSRMPGERSGPSLSPLDRAATGLGSLSSSSLKLKSMLWAAAYVPARTTQIRRR